MYYPANFNPTLAIELANLLQQAYEQFDAYKAGRDWCLKDGYELVRVVHYHRPWPKLLHGKTATAVEKEMEGVPKKKHHGQGIPMGFVATRGGNRYLVFRGTHNIREWIYDANIGLADYPTVTPYA